MVIHRSHKEICNILPPQVQTITNWWLPRMKHIIGDELVAVLLTGSGALDDYCDGWSDVDVCVVLRGGMPERMAPDICVLHDEMRDMFMNMSDWKSGQFIEGYYVSSDLASRHITEDWCYVADGSTRKYYLGNPITPFDQYITSHHSKLLDGRPVVVSTSTGSELAKQTLEDMATLSEYERQSGIWLCGMMHWLARTIVFWRDGIMLSKSAALYKEISGGSPYKKVYELALQARQEGSMHAGKYRDELLSLYAGVVPKAMQDISAFVELARKVI